MPEYSNLRGIKTSSFKINFQINCFWPNLHIFSLKWIFTNLLGDAIYRLKEFTIAMIGHLGLNISRPFNSRKHMLRMICHQNNIVLSDYFIKNMWKITSSLHAIIEILKPKENDHYKTKIKITMKKVKMFLNSAKISWR